MYPKALHGAEKHLGGGRAKIKVFKRKQVSDFGLPYGLRKLYSSSDVILCVCLCVLVL